MLTAGRITGVSRICPLCDVLMQDLALYVTLFMVVDAPIARAVSLDFPLDRGMRSPKPPTDLPIAQFEQNQMVDDIPLVYGKMGIGHHGLLLLLVGLAPPTLSGLFVMSF